MDVNDVPFIVTFSLEIFVIAVLLYHLKKLPPDDTILPIVGSLLTLNTEAALLKVAEYKEKYGKMFLLKVENFTVIVINDYKLIQKAFKRDEFLGRPDFQVWKSTEGNVTNCGILFTNATQNWQEQRQFALENLTNFGFGRQSMEDLLLSEVESLINNLQANMMGQPVSLNKSFNCAVFNSLWYIVSGLRFELDDPEFDRIVSLMTGHFNKDTMISPETFFPRIPRLRLFRPGLWEQTIEMYETMTRTFHTLIREHLFSYDGNSCHDFIDVYLRHHKNAPSDSGFHGSEGIRNLCATLVDFFLAGTETTSTTLLWAIFYMTKYPQIKLKLQEEIDRIIGTDRLPNRDDKQRMPYLEAFTNEVHRKGTILSMSCYHKVQQDCIFNGYMISEDAVVYANIYDAHNDKDFWGDPEVFRPERFLDPTETTLLHKEALMPFFTGKRSCIGEKLARDSLFYFLSRLLQRFSFERAPSSGHFNPDTPNPNVVNPYDFKVVLTSRSH